MNPLALFAGPYAVLARLGVIVVLIVAAGIAGWIKGNAHGTQKLIDYQGAQAIESLKLIARQGAATERVRIKYMERIKVIDGVATTTEKEVIKYVESKPLALACALDNRWLRLHDAAAAGALPQPAAGDDATAGGVTAAAVLPTITWNYAAAHRNAARLEALQGWVREQMTVGNPP